MRTCPENFASTLFPHFSLHLCSIFFRELSLQAADEDECGSGGQPPQKKKKKKTLEDEEGTENSGRRDAEHWVMKRQQRRARKAEEAVKNKRTVFVGNLPASCTKKVCQVVCHSIYLSNYQPPADVRRVIILFILQMLMSIFRDKGPIESIRFRSVVNIINTVNVSNIFWF